MSDPRDIFKYKNTDTPWQHILAKGILSRTECNEFVKIFKMIDWSTAEKNTDIDLKVFNWHNNHKKYDISMFPEAEKFLDTMLDPKFMEEIFRYYNVDFSQGYEYTLCFDWGGEKTYNKFHTDFKHHPDIITLQYYIDLENPQSTLRLKDKKYSKNEYDTTAMTGDAVMFHSSANTWHGFSSQGIKENTRRLSIRLRLKTNLTSNSHIFYPNKKDNLGLIIDSKDWDLEVGDNNIREDLHLKLAKYTLMNTRVSGFNNIMVINKNNTDLEKAIQTLRKFGVTKILILFNGAFVSEKTKEIVNQVKSSYTGKVLADLNRVARIYMIIDLNKIKHNKFQTSGNYFGDVLNDVNSIDPQDLDISYLHPDEKTIEFFEGLYYYVDHQDLCNRITKIEKKYQDVATKIAKKIKQFF